MRDIFRSRRNLLILLAGTLAATTGLCISAGQCHSPGHGVEHSSARRAFLGGAPTHVDSANGSVGDELTGDLRLQGLAIDEAEQPIGGAEVRLEPTGRSFTTEADGTFVFDDLASGRYVVSAWKDDFYSDPMFVRVDTTIDPVTLAMRRGTLLIAHVTGDRAPVEGARLSIGGRTIAITDVNGTATARGLGPGYRNSLEIKITAKGWAPSFIRMVLARDSGGAIEEFVTLRRGAPVEGIVLGPGEKPISRAAIQIWNARDGSWVSEATSREDGTWHVDALEAGSFRLLASSNIHAPGPDLDLEFDGRTPRRDLVLHVNVGGQVAGTVVDGKGSPVPDALVVADDQRERTYETRTGADGHFTLMGIKAGAYHIAARTAVQASSSVLLQIGPNHAARAQLVVEDARIAGVVLDDVGLPIIGARVEARATVEASTTSSTEVLTDTRGGFDLGALEPGDYILHASWPDQLSRRGESSGQRVRTGRTDVKLVLATPGMIVGRVLLNGEPLPYYGLVVMRDHEARCTGQLPTGISAEGGRFAARGIMPGTWQLALLGPGTKLKILSGIIMERGKVVDLGEIEMQRGQRISGYVRDSTGSPVPGARVIIGHQSRHDGSRLQQWFCEVYETTTDATGAYEFGGIDVQTYGRAPTVHAMHFRFGASLISELPQEDATVDFVLIGSGTIDGVIRAFRPHRAFVVRADRPDEPSGTRWVVANTAGEFRFEDVPPGEYLISMEESHGQEVTSARVHVVDNHSASVTLTMVKSAE